MIFLDVRPFLDTQSEVRGFAMGFLVASLAWALGCLHHIRTKK